MIPIRSSTWTNGDQPPILLWPHHMPGEHLTKLTGRRQSRMKQAYIEWTVNPMPADVQNAAAAALQERKDAKWWLGKEGQATLNGTKNRDVETFWQQAAAAHVNVRGNLKQVSAWIDPPHQELLNAFLSYLKVETSRLSSSTRRLPVSAAVAVRRQRRQTGRRAFRQQAARRPLPGMPTSSRRPARYIRCMDNRQVLLVVLLRQIV